MERLVVKNFGPIAYADIELKNVNIFIGPTGSGKSTLAKLVAIMRHDDFRFSDDKKTFHTFLVRFNVHTFLRKEESFIRYEWGDFYWEYNEGTIKTTYPFSNLGLHDLNFIFNRKTKGERLWVRGLANCIGKLNSLNLTRIKNEQAKKLILLIIKKGTDYLSELNKEESMILQAINTPETIVLADAVNKLKLEINQELFSTYAIYIPAERIFYSIFSNTLNAVLSSDTKEIPIPKYLNDFVREIASLEGVFNIPEMEMQFAWEEDKIKYLYEGEKLIDITSAASGVQSVMPLGIIFPVNSGVSGIRFILEEPELNLFPDSQYHLTKYIAQFFSTNLNSAQNSLLLTTHSPYILTAFDNLITAKNVVNEKPKLKNKVAEIIPEKYWLDFDNVSAYYLNPKPKKGKPNTESIMDAERKGIAGNVIDEISDKLSVEYSKLFELRNG